MVDAGQASKVAHLRVAFEAARGSCAPQAVAISGAAGLPPLRLAYLPYNGAVAPPAENMRWCLNVACANRTWVRHRPGSAPPWSRSLAASFDEG